MTTLFYPNNVTITCDNEDKFNLTRLTNTSLYSHDGSNKLPLEWLKVASSPSLLSQIAAADE